MTTRDQIAPAAAVLDDLLMYTPAQGACPITREEAHAMWGVVAELHGFSAVRAFLEVCKDIRDTRRA